MDHVQGSVQHPLAAAARRRRAQLQPVHRDHAQHQRATRSRSATSARSTWSRTSTDGELDHEKLKRTVAHRDAHARQRDRHQLLRGRQGAQLQPASTARSGLGIMGFQDCLHMLRIPYASDEAVEFADRSMEAVSYYAYWASTELAEERGRYATFKGSLWDRGILPQDTLKLLARGARRLRRGRRVRDAGLGRRCARASSSTACATRTAWRSRRPRPSPTSSACRRRIEPTYQNLYVKSNLSGEFTVVNEYLVRGPEEARACGTR